MGTKPARKQTQLAGCGCLSRARGLVERGGGGADASCLRLCLQAAGAVERQGSPASPPREATQKACCVTG